MRLWSQTWVNGERIPPRCAAACLDTGQTVVVADNRNPHLAWDDVPPGTLSFALIAHDFDGPSRPDPSAGGINEIPEDLPRIDFFHWLLVDLAPERREIAEGEFSTAWVCGGKPGPAGPAMSRQGLNDYTVRWAQDSARAGHYFGYDGPWPPPNDALVHHHVFTLYALSVARAPVDDPFTGHMLRRALFPHVLAEATLSGTYSLNPRHHR
jgi:Raf kinase inhibitor-like YbhB/YbcL family protein